MINLAIPRIIAGLQEVAMRIMAQINKSREEERGVSSKDNNRGSICVHLHMTFIGIANSLKIPPSKC